MCRLDEKNLNGLPYVESFLIEVKNFLVADDSATIKLQLRRTLVLPVLYSSLRGAKRRSNLPNENDGGKCP